MPGPATAVVVRAVVEFDSRRLDRRRAQTDQRTGCDQVFAARLEFKALNRLHTIFSKVRISCMASADLRAGQQAGGLTGLNRERKRPAVPRPTLMTQSSSRRCADFLPASFDKGRCSAYALLPFFPAFRSSLC